MSRYGQEQGASVPHSDKRDAFWKRWEPVVHRTMAKSVTTLVVSEKDHDTIWAFSCTQPGYVHMAVAKDHAGRGRDAIDIPDDVRAGWLRALLPLNDDRVVMTSQIPDLRALPGKPKWRLDERALVWCLL